MEEYLAERRGWQGSRLMQVMFCMGLEHALDKAPPLQARVAYQDDAYFFGRASHLASQWPTLVEALHESGHRVRNHKCQFWSPLADLQHQPPAGVQELAYLIPRVRGGLTLLGAAVQGEFEVQLNSPVLTSAAARATKAQHLVSRIRDLVVAQPTLTTAHLAWFLTSKSAAHALSYDARLVPSVALGFVAEPVVQQIEDVARFIVQGGVGALDQLQAAQLRLPGNLGGMGLRPDRMRRRSRRHSGPNSPRVGGRACGSAGRGLLYQERHGRVRSRTVGGRYPHTRAALVTH